MPKTIDKKGRKMEFRVSDTFLLQIDDVAKRARLTRSDVVREMIEDFLRDGVEIAGMRLVKAK